MANRGQVLTREMLLDAGNFDLDTGGMTINVHMHNLRGKTDSRPPQLFHTAHGRGYYFRRKAINETS